MTVILGLGAGLVLYFLLAPVVFFAAIGFGILDPQSPIESPIDTFVAPANWLSDTFPPYAVYWGLLNQLFLSVY